MNWYKHAQKQIDESLSDLYNSSGRPPSNQEIAEFRRQVNRDDGETELLPEPDLIQKGDHRILQDNEDWYSLWFARYEKNMENGGKEAGSYDGIHNYLTTAGTTVFRYQDSAIWGVERNGIFLPSHIAPSSRMGSYELINHISLRQPVIFGVTHKIGKQLTRLNFRNFPNLSFPQRGQMKEVWANDLASKMLEGKTLEDLMVLMK